METFWSERKDEEAQGYRYELESKYLENENSLGMAESETINNNVSQSVDRCGKYEASENTTYETKSITEDDQRKETLSNIDDERQKGNAGFSFYIPVTEFETEYQRRPPRRLKSLDSTKERSFTVDEKMLIADVLHNQNLKDKGHMGRSYKERLNRVKERREEKLNRRRQKVVQKMMRAEEKAKRKEKQYHDDEFQEPCTLTKGCEWKRDIEDEAKERYERKCERQEERRQRFETADRLSFSPENLERALFRREAMLYQAAAKYKLKMKTREENRDIEKKNK